MSSIPFKRECNDLVFFAPFLGVVVVTIVFATKYGDEFTDATQVKGCPVRLAPSSYCASSACPLSQSPVYPSSGIFMVLLAEALIWVTLNTITVNIVAAVFFAKKA